MEPSTSIKHDTETSAKDTDTSCQDNETSAKDTENSAKDTETTAAAVEPAKVEADATSIRELQSAESGKVELQLPQQSLNNYIYICLT